MKSTLLAFRLFVSFAFLSTGAHAQNLAITAPGMFSMENAGMVTYDRNVILSDPSSDTLTRQRLYADVAAHELAHQWFGDLVTTAWWDDIWLNEASKTMVVGAATTRKSASPAPSGALKLSVLGGRPVVSQVFLNGQGPYRFLLDTGAQTNQLDAAIARKLALVPTFKIEMATAAGTTRVGGACHAEVTLGSASAANQEFLFTTLDGVHALSSDLQGVLGQEFLRHFDYLLDLRSKTLAFDTDEPNGERVTMELIAGRPTLQTSLGRLVLDSGAETVLLFHGELGSSVSGIRTASGFAFVQTGGSVRIRIGEREFKFAQSASVRQPEVREDGLLPISVFKAVYVSNSGNHLVLLQ